MAFCEEDRAKVCRFDWSAGESGKNGGSPGFGGHGEDSVRWLSTNLEISNVPVSCHWIRSRMRRCEMPLEVWWSFDGRMAMIGSRVVGSMLWTVALSLLSQRLLNLEQRAFLRFGLCLFFPGQLVWHRHVRFDHHSNVHSRRYLSTVYDNPLEGAHYLLEESLVNVVMGISPVLRIFSTSFVAVCGANCTLCVWWSFPLMTARAQIGGFERNHRTSAIRRRFCSWTWRPDGLQDPFGRERPWKIFSILQVCQCLEGGLRSIGWETLEWRWA